MNDSRQRRAVVFVIDGWGAGYAGPYGNTWLDTPTLNQLADQSVLFEQAIAESMDLTRLYEAYWTGRHAALPMNSDPPTSLLVQCQQQGRRSHLVTDAPLVAQHPLANGFDDADMLEAGHVDQSTNELPAVAEARLSNDPEDTALGRLVAMALPAISDPQIDLCWIHSRGMFGAWDAPLALRDQFADDEDPLPPRTHIPPVGEVPVDADPDVLQGWTWAYAGQVALLDLFLEPVIQQWSHAPGENLLVVMGSRGYALGEHGHWGDSAEALHAERIQVPLLIATDDRDLQRVRTQVLAQTSGVYGTLCDWLGFRAGDSLLSLPSYDTVFDIPSAPEKVAVCRHGQHWAIRTRRWQASIRTGDAEHVAGASTSVSGIAESQSDPITEATTPPYPIQLYLKPDDRWDANDVADRCPHVVQSFRQLAFRLTQLDPGKTLTDLGTLPKELFEASE